MKIDRFLQFIIAIFSMFIGLETLCIEKERQALVQFKQGVIDEYDILSSWGREEENVVVGKHLNYLDLSNNDFGTSRIPDFIGLEYLNLQGPITEPHLSNLKVLDLSYNSFLRPDWIPPFELQVIGLSHCEMGHRFPQWLRTQKTYSYLDISFVGISDIAPN
ncbi:hypothetical protein KY285_024223 [Solanum tuberosum]|nr:hypothetical protein KY289_024558 [Solanum tuberosum]KAH0674591.1 hypothetical protein KY284_025678 [Solanum tuberosum]KAH0676422.1 hypothetical protein KY285_024223 [Solanum tuberosum]